MNKNPPPKRVSFISCLLLTIMGILIYSPALFNNFLGDDFSQIISNTRIKSPGNFFLLFTGSTYESGGAENPIGLFYRPIMAISFSIIYYFFNLTPFYFHLFQILLHISNSVLLLIFLTKFFNKNTSLILSTIFLIHPVNNEAVVYIANTQEVLFMFFGLLSLILIQKTKHRIYLYFLPFLYLLTLLSKETGILYLFISQVYLYLFKKPRPLQIAAFVSSLLAIVCYLILRYPIAQMHHASSSIAPITNAPLAIRLINVPPIITYYLSKFFFPAHISSNHFWIITKTDLYNFYLPLAYSVGFFIFLILLGVYYIKKRRDIFKIYLFFLIWFLTGISLHLQIIPLDATVADRWFYFPSIGILGLFAVFIAVILPKMHLIKRLNKIIILAFIMILALVNIKRTLVWKDGFTLYSHDIYQTPKNFILDNALGTELINNGQISQAKPFILDSVNSHPYYANLNNLAIIYTHEKKYNLAQKHLREALSTTKYYVVYENYSNFLLNFGDKKEAKKFTTDALLLFPNNAMLKKNLKQLNNY